MKSAVLCVCLIAAFSVNVLGSVFKRQADVEINKKVVSIGEEKEQVANIKVTATEAQFYVYDSEVTLILDFDNKQTVINGPARPKHCFVASFEGELQNIQLEDIKAQLESGKSEYEYPTKQYRLKAYGYEDVERLELGQLSKDLCDGLTLTKINQKAPAKTGALTTTTKKTTGVSWGELAVIGLFVILLFL